MAWFYMVLEVIMMIGIDLLFMALLILLVVPLGMFRQTAFAVLKRNFAGYFSNPTGYVFLCLFVFLTSLAAFWPHGFFASNLANFDQLNTFLPLIMLVYIPAITMSIWSEERRQGTDELLLTLPTTDIDIVLGKYFAAVFVFTVALLYSQICNYIVLVWLSNGDLDVGLLFTTYLGYWFIGISMLALGMVASFLTNNLTVAFVFGVLFNAPLVFLSHVDVIAGSSSVTQGLLDRSLGTQMDLFGRGLVGLGPIVYFVSLIGLGLYFSLILIGRRHWSSNDKDGWMWMHYVLRSIAVLLIALTATFIVDYTALNRIRIDVSEGKVNSLSPETVLILRQLATERNAGGGQPPQIEIDAFISAQVPPEYVQTRYELINLLREFDVLGGDRVVVNLHTKMRPFSEEAEVARKRFNIRPQVVQTRSQGMEKEEEVMLGASFRSGLERVTVPFFEYGMPVEYELIRSINTVAREQRKVVGVVVTRAPIMGGRIFDGRQIQQIPKEPIVMELEKQYDVEQVDPNVPITVWVEDANNPGEQRLRYDVLFVVQPSSLSPQGLANLTNAMTQGQPTAIFEDPLSTNMPVQGTSEPIPQDNMLAVMQGQMPRPQPKGDMRQLWDILGIEVYGGRDITGTFHPDIVWQAYNPYPQFRELRNTPEMVFIRPDLPDADVPFSEDSDITSGLEELLLPYPGAFSYKDDDRADELSFVPLIETGRAGVIRFDKIRPQIPSLETGQESMARKRGAARGRYILAAHIQGDLSDDLYMQGQPQIGPDGRPAVGAVDTRDIDRAVNTVYVADIDLMSRGFFEARNRPDGGIVTVRFQNLTFVLNVVDVLAGVDDYVNIRKRMRSHKTLKAMEERIEEAREQVSDVVQEYAKDEDLAKEAAEDEMQEAVSEYNKIVESYEQAIRDGENVDMQAYQAKRIQRDLAQQQQQQKYNNTITRLQLDTQDKVRQIERATDLEIERAQKTIKLHTLWVPVVPPLVLSLVVFTMRRLRERAGISRLRLK